jgi:SNF2 family DNA or RNA helicase
MPIVIINNQIQDISTRKKYPLTIENLELLLSIYPTNETLLGALLTLQNIYENFKLLTITKADCEGLYDHQKCGVNLLVNYPFNVGVFDEPGAGKTLQILKAYELLRQKDKYTLVVICPKNAIGIWEGHIEKFTHKLSYKINSVPYCWPDILIYNYEQVVKHLKGLYERAIEEKTILCLDEIHRLGNPNILAYKDILPLKNVVDRIWATDGTPEGDKPESTIGILNIMTNETITKADFKKKYINPMTGKYKNLDKLREIMSRFSIRRLKSECLDLPEKIFTDIDIEMTPAHRKLYNETKKDNADPLTLLGKLNNIVNMPPGDNPKIDMAMDLLDDYPGKVVIWSYYIDMLGFMEERLSKKKGYNYAIIHGGMSNDDNKREKLLFQNDPNCRVLLASISYAKEAIDLSNCSTFIYISRDFKKLNWTQSIERGDRIGQTEHPNIIVIKILGTIDILIDDILKNKIEWGKQITGDKLKEILRQY